MNLLVLLRRAREQFENRPAILDGSRRLRFAAKPRCAIVYLKIPPQKASEGIRTHG